MPRLSKTRFTETSLAKLKSAAGQGEKVHFDAATDSLGIRFRNGRATFFVWYRTSAGVKRLYLGEWPRPLSLGDARTAVAIQIGKVAGGSDPINVRRQERKEQRAACQQAENAKTGTVEKRFKLFLAAKQAEALRTVSEYEAVFRNHVLPAWRHRPVQEIHRRDVAKFLDAIAETHGVMLADRVLAYTRPFLLWHAAKYDHPAPVLSKLRRLKPDARRRERSLDDDEIRLVWATADAFKPEAFGAVVKLLLVTGQRRIEVAGMCRDEIDADGIWVIPASRFKGKREHAVPLSTMAREIIKAVPKLSGEFVLSTGLSHIRGFSKFKRAFDEKVLEVAREQAVERGDDPKKAKVDAWRLHDIRRTSRGLLSRAGVRPDWAETFIGHALPGLQKTYDRYSYLPERRFAADALAGMIDRVLKRQTGEVVPLREVGGR